MTAKLPFKLPRSVIELYKWSEGQRPQTGVGNDFFPGYGMDALPEAIQLYTELTTETEFPRYRDGGRHWFPVFRSGGIDTFAVTCGKKVTADGEVINDAKESEPAPAFGSLEAMLRTLLRCYEMNVYYVDKTGQLTVGLATYHTKGRLSGYLKSVDTSGFIAIAREFNPGIACWQTTTPHADDH
jgi:hypothetical protein